jgi:hypothetical protein
VKYNILTKTGSQYYLDSDNFKFRRESGKSAQTDRVSSREDIVWHSEPTVGMPLLVKWGERVDDGRIIQECTVTSVVVDVWPHREYAE